MSIPSLNMKSCADPKSIFNAASATIHARARIFGKSSLDFLYEMKLRIHCFVSEGSFKFETLHNRDVEEAISSQAIVPVSESEKKKVDALIELFNRGMDNLLSSRQSRSAEEFNQFAYSLSGHLIEIESICKNNLAICDLKPLFEKMEKVVKIVEQPQTSLLHGSVMEQMRALTSISTGVKVTPAGLAFYPPKISSFELLLAFEKFKQRWNYRGISIDTPVQEIYGSVFRDKVFTSLCFRKNENWFSSLFNDASKAISGEKDEEGELRDLVQKRIEKWGYGAFELGSVSSKFHDVVGEDSEYGTYLLLFLRNVSAKNEGAIDEESDQKNNVVSEQ
jgi:hypothetical protein